MAISVAERMKIPLSDFGDPAGRKFYARNQAEMDAAAHLIGKAANPDAVKKRLMLIAKRRGLTIPDAWQSTKKE